MKINNNPPLEQLGLSPAETRAYLTLLRHGSLTARGVADRAGASRPSIYPALNSLVDRGMVEAGAGYGSRFRALPPEVALPLLIERDREFLLERERLAKELQEELSELIGEPDGLPEEVVEIIRSPRAIGERFQRLQLETERCYDVLVKAPFLDTRKENPAQTKALGRGVRVRGLYERSVLESPEIGPYLDTWTKAGEECRIYPGELPLKLALFDGRTGLLPLETPGERQPVMAILIRHAALGAGLQMLFECLWQESESFPE